MANRLAGATSPYLLQHAENPVDWHQWGPEAFERARAEDKPVFLSVGYAACHWCHVMAHESFEDPETAAVLNAGFVPIKVDREERPDVDAIYMAAVQGMTGSGGWPMSVFLTPDARPFYGGTYFPSEPRYGMPSFRQVLEAIETSWRERRDQIEQAATQLADGLREQQSAMGRLATQEAPSNALVTPDGRRVAVPRLEPAAVETAVAVLGRDFDGQHGGWGGAPKFPQPAILELLLRRAVAGDRGAMHMVRTTLDAMADGGIHDQLGGGFHRYSTDAEWLVPHFEKMLYDNAQLARIYLHAWQATGTERYRDVAERTLRYLRAEMLTPEGLFAASQDADTAGVEGATFVWTRDEVSQVLAGVAPTESDDLAPSAPARLDQLFATAYGVNALGNWEGRTILSRVKSDAEVGSMYGLSPEQAAARLAAARDAMLDARRSRPQPARDDKAIAAWNGLALAAFADAAAALGETEYLAIAERAADALLTHLRGADGRLARSYRAGRTTADGLLEDYACAAEGLLSLYEATFEERWLDVARELMAEVEARFADPVGGWFDTANDHEELLLRPKDPQDGATPSGNAMATLVLLRLAELTGEGHQRSAAERSLEAVQPLLPRYPLGFGAWLVALDFAVAQPVEVAIVGDPSSADSRALIEVARAGYAPYRVLAAGDPASSTVELIQGRFRLNGNATAFVCRGFACRQPVTEPAALAAQLSE